MKIQDDFFELRFIFRKKVILFIILAIAFLIRIYNFSFPFFTSDEARIAYRGYTLATTGKDELGRFFPLLFNSLKDYDLPLTSYLTAGGELLFGKSDFGARMPFVIIGTLLVLLVYQIAKFFSQEPYFRFTSAFIVGFSPTLIFLSKIPNQSIVLTFIFTLLFYLLINKKNIVIIILTMIASLLTSKQAWFILLPFTLFVLFFLQKPPYGKRKFMLAVFAATVICLAFILFLAVPQAKRSLSENNFTVFSDVTIKNGIDKLRGQGMEEGWPYIVDRLLFNKSHFLTTGFLHWLSNISPARYFGQFDTDGKLSYSYLGTWTKVLILPLVLGLFFLIKRGNKNNQLFLILFLILTFPSILIYPEFNLEAVILTLPFLALIISFGFMQFNKRVTVLIFFLVALELTMNVLNTGADYKNTTVLRPGWIKELAIQTFEKSQKYPVAISDNITNDIVSDIEWHASVNPQMGFQIVPSPYKYRQYQFANIKIIGSDESLNTCGKNEKMEVFVSSRDLNKVNGRLEIKILKTYKDNNGEDRAYLIEGACIK